MYPPLDILNENGTPTGESKTYEEIHERGLLHRTVHVWLLNSQGQVLLQKRSKSVRVYAGYWDTSASGHVVVGQSSKEAAKMETEEELGLVLPLSNFHYLGTVDERTISNNGTHIENAFNDIYIVHSDLKLSEFKMGADEVADLRWIDREELKKWIKGGGELLVPHEEEYKKLFQYMQAIVKTSLI